MTILSWHIELARPISFVVLAALPLWFFFWRRSLVRLSPGRKVFSILLRTLLLLAVAAGLSDPTATGPSDVPMVLARANPLPPVAPPSLVVLTASDHVRAGVPFTLDLLVRSESSSAVKVELTRDSRPLLEEPMTLDRGENRKSIAAMVAKPSRVVYGVNVSGTLRVPPENSGTRSVPAVMAACAIYVDPPPRVLLVESQAVLAEHLRKALIGENVEVEVKPEPPGGVEGLRHYDLIILSNVPADALSKSQMAALQSYVRDGGGLIAVGGDHSFTVGGYRHMPLEKMLPVISESRTPKPKPTLAMVLVVDISGSMNDPVFQGSKERNIDLAKEALRRAVGMLGPRDQVGVLVFEDTSRWIWPLSPVTDKEKIIAKIDTIQAEGETSMYTPLEQAYLALRESYADVKHIIVTTDGIGGPGDFDGLARKMAAAGITMSTVGVGSEPVRPFMQALADKAKGRAYFCDNGKAIPQIFQTDTGVTAKIGITEEPFFPQVVHAAPVLRGLDMSKAPTLLGYVETRPRPEAQVVLAAKTGEPILALWHYGQGTTAAFTSDIQSRWAAPWLSWPNFGRFWVQLVRATMRQDRPPTSRLTANAADGRLYITLDTEDRDGRYINQADAKVRVISGPPLPLGAGRGEGEEVSTIPMSQIAPGRYAASQAAGSGTYWLNAEIRRDGKQLDTVRGAAVVLDMPETIVKLDGDVETADKPGLRTVLLWPWLLSIAAVVLVVDLAVRRTAK
jgi:Ca-activated chloride channel homolog